MVGVHLMRLAYLVIIALWHRMRVTRAEQRLDTAQRMRRDALKELNRALSWETHEQDLLDEARDDSDKADAAVERHDLLKGMRP